MVGWLGWILLALVLGVLLGRSRWRWPKRAKTVARETLDSGPTLVPDEEAVVRLKDIPGFEQMSRAQQQQVMRELKQRFLQMRGRSA